MRKLFFILIFPLLALCQSNDTINILSFNGSLEQPIGFGFNEIYVSDDAEFGFFFNVKFQLGPNNTQQGRNYSENLGAVINYMATTETDIHESFEHLDYGRSLSLQVGPSIKIFKNLYACPGIGLLYFEEFAQYNDPGFGGPFYFRTDQKADLMMSLHLSTVIKEKISLQVGLDIFPDNNEADYLYDNTFKRLGENAILSNISFGLGFVI